MGVASGCGEQEVGVASGSGWNLWVWLLGVVLRRYIDFLILLYSSYYSSSSSSSSSFFSRLSARGSVVSSDARLHVNPLHFLARRSMC